MKNIWYSIILSVLLIGCSTNNKNASIYDFIPNDASVILYTNTIESLKSNLNNNDFIQTIAPSSAYKTVTTTLSDLRYLNTSNPTLISLLRDKNDSLHFLFSTKLTPTVFQTDSFPNVVTMDHSIGKHSAKKTTYEDKILYTLVKDSILIGSSSSIALESVLNKSSDNASIRKMLNTTNTNNHLSVVINNNNGNTIETLFLSEDLPFSNFSNYIAFDTEITQDQLFLNGITKANDSTKSLINAFKNTIPQDNELAKIAPSNCDGFLSLTFDVFENFKNNLNAFNNKVSDSIPLPLFDNVVEVGSIYEGNNQAIILNSIDVISTKDALLSEQNRIETYRQVAIFSFSQPSLFKTTFTPLISFEDAKYYCSIDQFFVFANSIDMLQNIIANHQNETTLNSREHYKAITNRLSDASSILQVLSPTALKKISKANLGTSFDSSLANYKASAIQFVYDTDYAHFNGIVSKNKTKAVENSVTEVLNIKLDANLLNSPQFVTNHRTKGKEIVVQDMNNKLYLISNTGNVLWKKQISGPILGKVEQIDIYKNGRLQLAFATRNRVYLITREGKDVTGYPLQFNDDITQPLSVFDYDKNKNYRLFVTQGRNVLLYDAKGKTVRGFNFKKANETINHQPQHIRIGSKDYIVIKTDKNLNILNRRGEQRVKVKTKISYSKEAVYKYNNTFTTTSSDGKLVTIDQNGNVKTQSLQLAENHGLTTSSKTLVTQSENKLSIKGKTVSLDFANYTKPKLFYIYNKIYVSVTDLQSQKVLLFDSQAKSIANFPVYGNSSIDLDNIDKDRNLEFVTKGENNSILVYEIN